MPLWRTDSVETATLRPKPGMAHPLMIDKRNSE